MYLHAILLSWNTHPKISIYQWLVKRYSVWILFSVCYRLANLRVALFIPFGPHWNTRGQLLKIVIPFVRFHFLFCFWNALYTTQSPQKKARDCSHKNPVVNPTEMQLFNHFLFHRFHGRNTFVWLQKHFRLCTVYDLRLTNEFTT